MKYTLHLCGLCEKPLGQPTPDSWKPPVSHHGIVMQHGYSVNGWGNRKNWFSWGHNACCDECFEFCKSLSNEFEAKFSARLGINNPSNVVETTYVDVPETKALTKRFLDRFKRS